MQLSREETSEHWQSTNKINRWSAIDGSKERKEDKQSAKFWNMLKPHKYSLKYRQQERILVYKWILIS